MSLPHAMNSSNIDHVPAALVNTLTMTDHSLAETKVSHFDKIEKGIIKMPQFHDSEEFFKCLTFLTAEQDASQDPTQDLSRFASELMTDNEGYKYEVIIENQRGATMFGIPLFSKESLLYPLDPPKYQTLKGHAITSLNLYPLPSKAWKWSWSSWYVLMIKDVDQEGWVYSRARFGSHKWKGIGRFGNFVRRRVWIRMREQVNDQEFTSLKLPSTLVLDTGSNKDGEGDSRPASAASTADVKAAAVPSIHVFEPSNENLEPQEDTSEPGTNSDREIVAQLVTFLQKLGDCRIDRIKIDRALEFFFVKADLRTLEYLLEDYEQSQSESHVVLDDEVSQNSFESSDKTSTWIYSIVSVFDFNESRRTFLKRLETKINDWESQPDKNNRERMQLLNSVFDICRRCLVDTFYDSERRRMT